MISLLEADDDSGCDETFDIIHEKETPFKKIFMLNDNFKVKSNELTKQNKNKLIIFKISKDVDRLY